MNFINDIFFCTVLIFYIYILIFYQVPVPSFEQKLYAHHSQPSGKHQWEECSKEKTQEQSKPLL